MRGRGGYIGFSRFPAASAYNSAAIGVWTLREAEALKRAGTWPVATPALLDSVTGAAAAYSLRNLFAGATTAVVRVRRSSDNAELDFSGAGVLDGTLAAWVGSGNNGFVRTWYDQSGNNRHAGQTTTGLQPTIVASGAVTTLNSLPAIDWPSASADKVLTATITTTTAISTLAVFSAVRRAGGYIKLYNLGPDNVTSGGALTPLTGESSQDWGDSKTLFLTNGYVFSRTAKVISSNSPVTSSATTQHMLFASVSSSVAQMHVNKTEISYAVQSTGNASVLTNTTLYVGNNEASVQQHIGRMQEIIIWTTNKSGERTSAENEVAAYYGI